MTRTRQRINPYMDRIFGKWFKNIVTLLLIVVLTIVLIFALRNEWIDKELSLQIAFLILGALLGAWISNGKK